ncbi:MAG: hypothetical protein AB7V50_01045 [Vampirovibrionia bacterium]
MVDKLNRINVNVGSVNNNLQKESSQQAQEEVEVTQENTTVATNHVDPDTVMDAMKKHGLHNMNNVMASGQVGSKSITDSINYFTSAISPEKHAQITEKVKDVCKQEFPTLQMNSDTLSEVVDNLIFNSLLA